MAAAGPLRLYLKERVIFMIKKIGILFADSMEYLPFLNIAKEYGGSQIIRRGNRSVGFSLPCKSGRVMLIGVECGIGKVCAASAAAFLIADDRVDYIFNAGLSGAWGWRSAKKPAVRPTSMTRTRLCLRWQKPTA